MHRTLLITVFIVNTDRSSCINIPKAKKNLLLPTSWHLKFTNSNVLYSFFQAKCFDK